MKTYAVKLQVFKGKKNYDEKGNITSQTHKMDAPIYDSLEWKNFLKNFLLVGYSDMKVISVSEIIYTKTEKKDSKGEYDVKTTYKALDESNEKYIEVVGSVKEALNPQKPKKELTPDQQRIAELEKKLELLTNQSKNRNQSEVSKSPALDDDIDDIQNLRDRYIALTGNEPDKRWKEPRLKAEIEAEKSKKEQGINK